jgi:hypothetical protein
MHCKLSGHQVMVIAGYYDSDFLEKDEFYANTL